MLRKPKFLNIKFLRRGRKFVCLSLFSLFGSPLFSQGLPLSSILPEVPAQYRFPSLVCGRALPVPTPSTMATLADLFSRCVTQQCFLSGALDYNLTPLAQQLAQTVSEEARSYLQAHHLMSPKFTLFCAFFSESVTANILSYVTCSYTLNAHINYDLQPTCGSDKAGLTRVLGPNKATISLEIREGAGEASDLIVSQYGALGSAYVHQIRMQNIRFYGSKVRFPGLFEGFEKAKLLSELNCGSETASKTSTRPFRKAHRSDTFTSTQTSSLPILPPPPLSLTISLSPSLQTLSLSNQVSPSSTEEETKSLTPSLSPLRP